MINQIDCYKNLLNLLAMYSMEIDVKQTLLVPIIKDASLDLMERQNVYNEGKQQFDDAYQNEQWDEMTRSFIKIQNDYEALTFSKCTNILPREVTKRRAREQLKGEVSFNK